MITSAGDGSSKRTYSIKNLVWKISIKFTLILQNFLKQLVHRTRVNECFCRESERILCIDSVSTNKPYSTSKFKSSMTEFLIIYKPDHWFAKQINVLISIMIGTSIMKELNNSLKNRKTKKSQKNPNLFS